MFWKTVGRWALLAVAVPLAAAGMRRIVQRSEARSGSSRLTRVLGRTASGLDVISGRGRKAVAR